MPYRTNAEVPPDVKRRFTGHCLTVWREAWNDTHERYGSEKRAFATAEIAGQNCMDARKTATKAEWDTAYINNLPDSAFAYIESGGEKDDEGKTTPRSLRHFPHHNAQGSLDKPHLRNALSRGPQSDVWPSGKGHLERHAEEAKVGDRKTVSAVKFADGTDNIIEGLAIPFGGPMAGKDLQGEAFGPDTDLALEWFPEEGRPVIFDHGLDEGMKTALVGRQIAREAQDAGHWVKVQLDKRNRYFEQISRMVSEGALSFSSGSLGHLVKTEKDGSIKAWPWVELSLTPTPANPDAAVYAVKSSDAIEHIAAVKSMVPEPLKAAVDAIEDGFTEPTQDDPEPESFAVHTERVLADVQAWAKATDDRLAVRAKAGRQLSKANIAALKTAHETLTDLVDRATRTEEDITEAKALEAQHLLMEARLNGVLVG